MKPSSKTAYRRQAILGRIHRALDAFVTLQKVDWEYDIRQTLNRILGLAMEEIEFDGAKVIERGLLIVRSRDGDDLEVHAGWGVGEGDRAFSRTIVGETLRTGVPVLCENAASDPRFRNAESIRELEVLSCISVPLSIDGETIGAVYVESRSAGRIFVDGDQAFLEEFARAITAYVKVALTHQRHVREIRTLRAQVRESYGWGRIIGRSRSMDRVFELARIAAKVERTVLLTGESGAGKELLARAIHYNGPRRDGAFVVVDCSALTEPLLESELFGHIRGSFTGATGDKVGAFEEANGGTLLLDEISDASKPLQQKLRRVLQEGEIRRVGENRYRPVDVRVICATNRDIRRDVEEGRFMRDLYFRINKFPIHVPPLRERREDIPLLAVAFVGQAGGRKTPPVEGIHPDAMRLLLERDWADNNIRELRNAIELAVDLETGEAIQASTLREVLALLERADGAPRREAGPAGGIVTIAREPFQALLAAGAEEETSPYHRVLEEFSSKVVAEALRLTRWKLRPAARTLGISPMKVREIFRRHLEEALGRAGGDLGAAARALGIPLAVLARKIDDLGIDGG